MKMISALVLAVLVAIPLASSVFRAVIRAFAKNPDVVTSPFLTKLLKLEQIKSRRRLLCLVGSLYGVLLLASTMWFFFQVIAPAFGLDLVGLLFVGITMSLVFIVPFAVWYSTIRNFYEKNPPRRKAFHATVLATVLQLNLN